VQHAPDHDVATGGRAEREQVTADDLGTRLGRVQRLGFGERNELTLMPVSPCSRSTNASPSSAVTEPVPASARTEGASAFACAVSQGKFVSLIEARMSA
jgi:hypothetical protein